MAYTTDRTWVTGEVVTAAYLNTWVRDNMKWLSTDKPMVRVYNNANQNANSGAYTHLTFNSESYDNAGVHSVSSNTDRLSMSAATVGKWLFGGCVYGAANATGYRYGSLFIDKANALVEATCPSMGAVLAYALTPVGAYEASSTNYFTLAAWQDTGAALTIFSGTTNLWGMWVGV